MVGYTAKLSFYGNLPKMNPQRLRLPAGGGGGEGVMPYMGYIGMCRCEGYGFQAVYSGLWDGVYKSQRLGIIFQETDQLVEYFI